MREKSVQQPSLRQVLAVISLVSSSPLRLALRRRHSCVQAIADAYTLMRAGPDRLQEKNPCEKLKLQ